MEWHRGEERGRTSRGTRADCTWPGFSCCLSSRGMHCPLERGNALLRMEKSMLCWYLGNSCQVPAVWDKMEQNVGRKKSGSLLWQPQDAHLGPCAHPRSSIPAWQHHFYHCRDACWSSRSNPSVGGGGTSLALGKIQTETSPWVVA